MKYIKYRTTTSPFCIIYLKPEKKENWIKMKVRKAIKKT